MSTQTPEEPATQQCSAQMTHALILSRVYDTRRSSTTQKIPATPALSRLPVPTQRLLHAPVKRAIPQQVVVAEAEEKQNSFSSWRVGLLCMVVVIALSLFFAFPQSKHDVPPAVTKQQVPAASPVVRIDQTDPSQYDESSQYTEEVWGPSTCSAASVVAVMNAYESVTGHHYRIADVLPVEAKIGAITASDGLLHQHGIDQTLAQFGFVTQWMDNPSLDQLLSIASTHPAIVNFPPSTWTGGHFLVVLGGLTKDGVQYVHLADSSTLNMQYMTRKNFLQYWRGLAAVAYPSTNSAHTAPLTWNVLCLPSLANFSASGSYSVVGKPSLTPQFIDQVLGAYKSPASGMGQDLYDSAMACGIDPAFELAFFLHESTLGKNGEAAKTLSLGNLRCISGYPCVDQQNGGGYAKFETWREGFQVWARLIFNLYVAQWKFSTIDAIIPTYAPPSDGNDDGAYISSLKHAIDTWHSGVLIVP